MGFGERDMSRNMPHHSKHVKFIDASGVNLDDIRRLIAPCTSLHHDHSRGSWAP